MRGDPRVGIGSFLVEDAKIDDYLLNLSHPDGGPKAALYLRHRFDRDGLKAALALHGRNGRLLRARETPFGIIFVIADPMMTPLNNYLDLRSVWEIRPTQPTTARLVTTTFA